MAATKHKAPVRSSEKMNSRVWLFSLLLTLQYGAQPLISKRCTRYFNALILQICIRKSSIIEHIVWNLNVFYVIGTYRREVIVTSSVLTCEIAKVVCALIFMARDGSLKKVYKEWTLVGALTASGLPAAIYALQNSLLQISYKNLDSLTFSMLNQTKIIFTALFTYLILRYEATTYCNSEYA